MLNRTFGGLLTLTLGLMSASVAPRTIDLKPYWDDSLPLANPHKGWYHHYFDNQLGKYLIQDDQDLIEFPGMDHLYLRLAWAHLEPQEGVYRWEVIDRVIEKWTAKGFGIALRITCKETGKQPVQQQFATPKWVKEAGAKGEYYTTNRKKGDPTSPWEPDYGDPVFLTKLENFIRALAERYDGEPWLRYVDIGSLGEWGEGHTFYSSGRIYGAERIKHVKIHAEHFKKTQLVVTDDFVRAAEREREEEGQRLRRFILDQEISYRDDSIFVEYFTYRFPKSFSIANPEYFEDVYLRTPTVLEMAHIRNYIQDGKWQLPNGKPLVPSGNAAEFLAGTIRTMRATYIGYHGDPRDWFTLPENPKLTHDLLNLCGYWYFPHQIVLPDAVVRGNDLELTLTWENRGVAPAYHSFDILFRLSTPQSHTVTMDSRNRRWLPAKSCHEQYTIPIAKDLPPGEYKLAIKLNSPTADQSVLLPLKQATKDAEDFYSVGNLKITH